MGTGKINEPLYICVCVPEFPAQALMRLRAEQTRAPVAVLAGNPPLEQVCSRNAQAGRLGVEHGMMRAELEVFQGLCILRRSETEERAARAVLLEAAASFTSRVEGQPSFGSAFQMVLDMTGTRLVFGTPLQAATNILRRLKELNFHAQIAACVNFQAAISLAPSAGKSPLVVPAGQEQNVLSGLPLSALPLTPRQSEMLSLWGLTTLGQLAALPEEDLVVRLGQEGKRLRLLALGEHPHLMVPEKLDFLLEEFLAFDSPIELLDSLLFVLGPMLDQLLVRSQSRALALASVTLKLGLDGGSEHERTVKPALPVAQRDVLLKLMHLDLQAHPPSAGVLSIHLHAEPGERSKVQIGLFAPQLPEPIRLDVTLARIAALVGEDRVGCPRLRDTHQPGSFTMERFTVPATAPDGERKLAVATALRRCRPPVPVTVRRQDHQPMNFTLHGKWYAVQETYGPWRRSGDWWSAEVWSQEEWDVRATSASDDVLLCILTHDLLRQQWQMVGLYD